MTHRLSLLQGSHQGAGWIRGWLFCLVVLVCFGFLMEPLRLISDFCSSTTFAPRSQGRYMRPRLSDTADLTNYFCPSSVPSSLADLFFPAGISGKFPRFPPFSGEPTSTKGPLLKGLGNLRYKVSQGISTNYDWELMIMIGMNDSRSPTNCLGKYYNSTW